MRHQAPTFSANTPFVVGSFGSLQDLRDCSRETARESCDWIEIRLDLLWRDGWQLNEKPWRHLTEMPLLFTPRCQSEGGVLPLSPQQRHEMILATIDDANAVDVEIAQQQEMRESIELLKKRNIPWIASSHHFQQLPPKEVWRQWRDQAVQLGATVAKFAAQLQQPEEIDTLESFQRESCSIAVATMGMGTLAPASRVRCALAGSSLNYGYLGQAPTAPGQWPAADLRKAILQGRIPSIL